MRIAPLNEYSTFINKNGFANEEIQFISFFIAIPRFQRLQ